MESFVEEFEPFENEKSHSVLTSCVSQHELVSGPKGIVVE